MTAERGSRREFLMGLAGMFVAVQQRSSPDSQGRVFDPSWAGRSREPIIAADNDPGIQAIEKRLRCSCGCGLDIYTCRTTDFACTYSPGLHKQVMSLAAQGKTAQEIIDEFVAEYGQQVLMAPPKRGFNLAGYFVPSIAIVAAGVMLIRMLRRWTRAAAVPAAASDIPSDASPAELERLRRELDKLPG